MGSNNYFCILIVWGTAPAPFLNSAFGYWAFGSKRVLDPGFMMLIVKEKLNLYTIKFDLQFVEKYTHIHTDIHKWLRDPDPFFFCF